MSEPIWLQESAVLAVHNKLVADVGGGTGIRDGGLLNSALARPINIRNYDDQANIYQLAAAYTGGIVQNHPFVDGNKRTGFMAAFMFLGRNDLRLVADEASATVMTLALASSEIEEEEFANWLQQNCTSWSE